jgi:hypothetical protein
VLSIALGLWGYFKMVDAEKQQKIAEENYKNFVKSEFKRNFDEGLALENKEAPDFNEALKRYQAARSFFDTLNVNELNVDDTIINIRQVDSLIQSCGNKIPKKDKHEELMRQFENSEKKREYLKAMNFLNEALILDYYSKIVKKKKADLFSKALKVYDNDYKDFDEMKDYKLRDETRIKKNILEEAYHKNSDK